MRIYALVLAASLAVPLAAQPQADFREFRHLRLAEIIGMQVRSASGEALGVIRDLLLDEANGKIEYIAVERPDHSGLSRYPVDALVAGEPGEVTVKDVETPSASAGGTRLSPYKAKTYISAASRRGDGEPVVDLLDGKLGFAPPH
jgi:sporulation protein YlmC with PRC-barrel domain